MFCILKLAQFHSEYQTEMSLTNISLVQMNLNDGFSISNDGFLILNDGFSISNNEFSILNDGFSIANVGFR